MQTYVLVDICNDLLQQHKNLESAADAMPASEAEQVRQILLPHEPHACGGAAFKMMLCLAHCGLGDGPLRIWAEGLFCQVTSDHTPK
jgi:hypothetical protein